MSGWAIANGAPLRVPVMRLIAAAMFVSAIARADILSCDDPSLVSIDHRNDKRWAQVTTSFARQCARRTTRRHLVVALTGSFACPSKLEMLVSKAHVADDLTSAVGMRMLRTNGSFP